MQGQFTISGVRRFKDDVQGEHYDFTKVLIQTPFPKSNPDNIGFDTVPALCGTKKDGEIFTGKKFPLVIDAEYEVTTKGIEIYEFKLVERPNVAQGQQPKQP